MIYVTLLLLLLLFMSFFCQAFPFSVCRSKVGVVAHADDLVRVITMIKTFRRFPRTKHGSTTIATTRHGNFLQSLLVSIHCQIAF